MNYRLFQYALPAPPELEDLNAYLAAQRVAAVAQHIVQTPGGAMLLFIVETVGGRPGPAAGGEASGPTRIDYREVFGDADFSVFSRLREERKTIANTEGVPIYTPSSPMPSSPRW
jgi:hypothetical protein